MSPVESSQLEELRVIAQMSDATEISSDLEELSEMEGVMTDARTRIEQMQRYLQILSSAA